MNSKIPLLLLLVFVISGCNLSSNDEITRQNVDIDLFRDENCVTSCWQGLIAGQSNIDDVISLIQTSPFENYRQGTTSEGGYTFHFARHIDGYGITLVEHEGTLFSIQLGANNLDLTLGDIITQLGSPDYIRINYQIGAEVARIYPNVTLYYPQIGYVFYSQDSDQLSVEQVGENQINICLNEEAVITSVDILESAPIEEIIYDLEIALNPSVEDIIQFRLSELSTWTGFECIEVDLVQ